MKDIEQFISPLVSSMFPSFYREEGENFIDFVKAYHEWLEENHQLLTLQSTTGFSAGDTITQGSTTGTIVDVEDNTILVRVPEFDSFRCNSRCNDYTPLSGVDGAQTQILKEDKLNPIYYARKLFAIGDIDETVDQFVLQYKEKYLKNIEFDTASNKKLLVKNSLDLYRSKGTQRAIDLFFRLVYATPADVYYPGEDVFTLSAASFQKPQYLEISKSAISVDLVGKQIKGVTSGATAFVEKYVKRRVSAGFVYLFYISNINGVFEKDELLQAENFFDDLPKVLGSLTDVTILTNSSDFAIGDIVTIISSTGEGARARVSSLAEQTGLVDFELIKGEYGYTDSADTAYTPTELATRTQSLVSEKVLLLSNVQTANIVKDIVVTAGGTGYSNTDLISCPTYFTNATARPTTNSTGGIEYVTVLKQGSGFYTDSPNVSVSNSSGGSSSGTGATFSVTTIRPGESFRIFEQVTQQEATVVYSAASNNQLLTPGLNVVVGNSTVNLAFGTIQSNANGALGDANGQIVLNVSNNGVVGTGNTITVVSNTSVNCSITSVTNTSATGRLMGVPKTANVVLENVNGTISTGDSVYVVNPDGTNAAAASVASFVDNRLELTEYDGGFRVGDSVLVAGKPLANGTVKSVTLSIGVDAISNNFSNTFNPQIWCSNTGTTAVVSSVSAGSGADFRIGSVSDAETVLLNTDQINSNNTNNENFLDVGLSDTQFYFPKSPGANVGNVMFTALGYDTFSIGTISTLARVDQGSDYNVPPYVLPYQPYVGGRYDYDMVTTNTVGTFAPGERILQQSANQVSYTIEVDNDAGFELGQKVFQGSANGIVDSLSDAANTITVVDVNGAFAVNSTPISAYSNTTISALPLSISNTVITFTARGLVELANSTYIRVQRTQYDNLWQKDSTITGQSSGATATIVEVTEDTTVLPIGINGEILANTTTSNGSVASLEIIDSGIGYNDNQEVFYISADGQRSGTAVANAETVGTGSGFYKTTKGFLSSDSGYTHDGDYWHEYSYEVLSRVPLDKYRDMFKDVMHVAGTRFFGGVVLETVEQAAIQYANSSVVQS